jgi:hypothetical protein
MGYCCIFAITRIGDLHANSIYFIQNKRKKMKMTPEQKAFYDFGVTWGGASVFHTYVRSVLKDRGYQINTELLHHFRDKECSYGMVVREAWKCRRRYRMWTTPQAERICENCAHEGTHPYATPCSECFRCPFAQAYEGFCDNWQPKV